MPALEARQSKIGNLIVLIACLSQYIDCCVVHICNFIFIREMQSAFFKVLIEDGIFFRRQFVCRYMFRMERNDFFESSFPADKVLTRNTVNQVKRNIPESTFSSSSKGCYRLSRVML